MKFEDIPNILSKYTFSSKMEVCQLCSKSIISINGLVGMNELINKLMPWEIETFALFSVLNHETDELLESKTEESQRLFIEMMSLIRNYEHPKLKTATNNKFADYLMIVSGLTQFSLQENIYIKHYRYSFIYNYCNEEVNMKNEFFNKFKCTYEDFRKFSLYLNLMFLHKSDEKQSQNATPILAYVFNKYNHVVKNLIINRSELVKTQSKTIKNIEQYMYGFRYFYQYPFIEYQKQIFIPLPHLLIQSTSASLLFRLTEGNDSLRNKFGKEVLEEYLYDVCKTNKNIIEIHKEYVYKKKGTLRTLDIMLQLSDIFVLMDSKAFSPRIALRDLSDEEIEYSTKLIVKSVKQVYTHITKKFQKSYNPFQNQNGVDLENVFGIVVIAEDNFIGRELIMKRAAAEISIGLDTEEYKYLCSNVKVLSLYSIEEIFFNHIDIDKLLKANRDDSKKWFNYSINNASMQEKNIDPKIENLVQSIKKDYSDIYTELKQIGLVQ